MISLEMREEINKLMKEFDVVRHDDEEQYMTLISQVIDDIYEYILFIYDFSYSIKLEFIVYKMENLFSYLWGIIDKSDYDKMNNELKLLIKNATLTKKLAKLAYNNVNKLSSNIDNNRLLVEIERLLIDIAYVLINIKNSIVKKKDIDVRLNCYNSYFTPIMPTIEYFDFESANDKLNIMIKKRKKLYLRDFDNVVHD